MKEMSLYDQLHLIVDEDIGKSPYIWKPQSIQDVVTGIDEADNFLQNYLLITGDEDYLPRTRHALQEAIKFYVETGKILRAMGIAKSVDPHGGIMLSPAQLLFNTTYRGTEAAQDDFYRVQLQGDADLMAVQTNLLKSLSDIGKGIYSTIYHIGYAIGNERSNANEVALRAQELFNHRLSA